MKQTHIVLKIKFPENYPLKWKTLRFKKTNTTQEVIEEIKEVVNFKDMYHPLIGIKIPREYITSTELPNLYLMKRTNTFPFFPNTVPIVDFEPFLKELEYVEYTYKVKDPITSADKSSKKISIFIFFLIFIFLLFFIFYLFFKKQGVLMLKTEDNEKWIKTYVAMMYNQLYFYFQTPSYVKIFFF